LHTIHLVNAREEEPSHRPNVGGRIAWGLPSDLWRERSDANRYCFLHASYPNAI